MYVPFQTEPYLYWEEHYCSQMWYYKYSTFKFRLWHCSRSSFDPPHSLWLWIDSPSTNKTTPSLWLDSLYSMVAVHVQDPVMLVFTLATWYLPVSPLATGTVTTSLWKRNYLSYIILVILVVSCLGYTKWRNPILNVSHLTHLTDINKHMAELF